jgi:hypothetical protein
MGAKLGAIVCGFLWTAVDSDGIESPSFRPVRTTVDTSGRGLEIYGSGGWVFESPRARCRIPCNARDFRLRRLPHLLTFGSHVGSQRQAEAGSSDLCPPSSFPSPTPLDRAEPSG